MPDQFHMGKSSGNPSSALISAAARAALASAAGGPPVAEVVFVTTNPPYLDKTNATAIHAALGLDQSVGAYDAVGSVRSGSGAVRHAADGTLLVVSDVRVGLPS